MNSEFREKVEAVLARHRRDDPVTGCWLWDGCKLPTGHGQARVPGKTYLVHRLSAWLHLGLDIENRYMGSRRDASQVNHKPECPNASCFNPEHLYVGTQRENIHDIPAEKRGLGALPIMGQCRRGHPHDPATYQKGVGCRICRRATWRVYAAKEAKRLAAREQRWLEERAS